ncbi:hypothetical protein DSO57_1001246 [Entomophthora muscae]|uniref:Uncharacterized protein n=1 Tax=Entomophthora muscae TaxID=34485 RepID=A0ACC2SM85_9FUNG|nr:hypothetical protein DSO57_1001246 [Entomophthora muscae]
MVNRQKRNRKPILKYTDVPEQRINKDQRGIPKIPVGNVHVHSPVLASEEAEFTKILGGKIEAAFYSLSSTVSYKPSTSSMQDSGMPTSSQLSTIAKKRSRSNKSKATTTTPTDKTNESVPRLTNLLQNLNKGEVSSTSVVVQEDSQGSFIKMVAYLCWERIPILQFRGPVVMWSTLMLALENPYVISTKRLEVRKNIHWQIPMVKLIIYAQLCLQDFSFNGTIKYLVLSSFWRWFLQCGPILGLGSAQCPCGMVQIVTNIDCNKLWSCVGSRQSMVLVGNLVLRGSKVVYHQRLHHMPKYIEWLLGVMYSVGGKAPEEYAQQESLLWEYILLGLAFPYSIDVNCVNFLPINNSLFLPFAFCWLPNVWIIYAAIAKVLIQLCLGLEAIVSQ